jgi:hypothetical protein
MSSLDMPHGLEMFKMPTMLTQLLSALTRVSAIERPVNASASLTMMVLLVRDLFALTDAVILVFASLKINLQSKLEEYMPLHGMLKSKSDVFVILAEEVQTAP